MRETDKRFILIFYASIGPEILRFAKTTTELEKFKTYIHIFEKYILKLLL